MHVGQVSNLRAAFQAAPAGIRSQYGQCLRVLVRNLPEIERLPRHFAVYYDAKPEFGHPIFNLGRILCIDSFY